MPEIDGLRLLSEEQVRHERYCVFRNFCFGLFELDAFILDQCGSVYFTNLVFLRSRSTQEGGLFKRAVFFSGYGICLALGLGLNNFGLVLL